MLNYDVELLKRVNAIQFGMSREEVRNIVNRPYKEFKKSKFSRTTTDDFGAFHVFYNDKNECEAIEIFEIGEITINGECINKDDIKAYTMLLADIEIENDSYISKEKSVGIYAPNGKIESVLFAVEKYYI